mmetsp:Transcript_11702/g.16778  ORF Transcript_11702/g.16778 Transcript_11702/m.16778 type:complete len:186 (-) Transcript_11702:990-1547(-)
MVVGTLLLTLICLSSIKEKECERRSKLSSRSESATSSSSAAATFGLANDEKSRMTNTKIVTDDGMSSSDNCNLKEDGCSTADTEADNDLTGSNPKKSMQNDDDDASAQSKPQQKETTFPQQLMDLIESETTDDNAVTLHGQKAIEWLSTGDKFIIRDKVALESRVLPKYFNNKCKFMSFVRKLYR